MWLVEPRAECLYSQQRVTEEGFPWWTQMKLYHAGGSALSRTRWVTSKGVTVSRVTSGFAYHNFGVLVAPYLPLTLVSPSSGSL